MATSSTKIISATRARSRWFELLNLVYFTGDHIVIEKNNIPLVRMIPAQKPKLASTHDVIEKTFGFLKGVKRTGWPKENASLAKQSFKEFDRLWNK